MKELSTNTIARGFSTLELLIALALMTTIMVGAVVAITSAQYWLLSAQTAGEALELNKNVVDTIILASSNNFQAVSGTLPRQLRDLTIPSNQSCILGGLCYVYETKVRDISSCAKDVVVDVRYKVGLRYATSSVSTNIYMGNGAELIASYSDCLVSPLLGNWQTGSIGEASKISQPAVGTTGIEVLGEYLYVTSTFSPHLRIYKIDANPHIAPVLVGSSSDSLVRLNDIEVIRELSNGRIYAYVTQHSTTSQLGVYDVSNPAQPLKIVELPLLGVASTGSFPQGWRVVAYGGQLFVVSRETTGPELHIFSIINPRLPKEIATAAINLNRTVNEMVVRDEVVGTSTRRFLYLAASSDLKEVGVYDVTSPVPVEVSAINLVGSADAMSLMLTGNTLYVGRKSSFAPELYAFSVSQLTIGELELQGSSEVGAEVLALGSTGNSLLVGTGKNGEEFQVWNPQVGNWSASVSNAGRISYSPQARLAALGFDISHDNVYAISHSQLQPETISVLYSP